jgi:hypothetical protein
MMMMMMMMMMMIPTTVAYLSYDLGDTAGAELGDDVHALLVRRDAVKGHLQRSDTAG